MPNYWLYTDDDERGTIQSGDTPQKALETAMEGGWYPEPGETVYIYPLGKLTTLYLEPEEEDA